MEKWLKTGKKKRIKFFNILLGLERLKVSWTRQYQGGGRERTFKKCHSFLHLPRIWKVTLKEAFKETNLSTIREASVWIEIILTKLVHSENVWQLRTKGLHRKLGVHSIHPL